MEYEQKLVLYIDILGFTNYVGESEHNNELIEKLFTAIEKPTEIETEQYILLDVGDLSETEVQISHFSDTVVLSVENTYRGLLYLIMYCIKVYYRLIKMDLYFRGSIVSGKLVHTKENILGPALIKAHTNERDIAKYPRVIIDENALTVIDSENLERKKFINRFIRIDRKDKQIYVHVLFAYGNMQFKTDQIIEIYKKINNQILKAKMMDNKDKGQRIISKYIWFSKYMEEMLCYPNHELFGILSKHILTS